MNDEEFVNFDNVDALNASLQPRRLRLPISLPDGRQFEVPIQVMTMAYGMEASDREHYKDGEANDTTKARRVYVRKMNMGLQDGWTLVNDKDYNLVQKGETKIESQTRLLRAHKIPLTLLSMRDYNRLQEAMFPGSMDNSQDIRDSLVAIHNAVGRKVSIPNANDDGAVLLPETV
jgi:hypothetical protein